MNRIFSDITANAGFTFTLGKRNNEDLNAHPIPEPKLMRVTELKVSIELKEAKQMLKCGKHATATTVRRPHRSFSIDTNWKEFGKTTVFKIFYLPFIDLEQREWHHSQ